MFNKFISAVLILFIFTQISVASPKTGEVAPTFSVKDSKGVERNLSDMKGKIVVLEWTNPDCPFVKKHYKSNNMQDLQKKYTESGVVWLSINSSAAEKQGNYSLDELNKKVADSGASPTGIIKDEEGTLGKLYGAKTTPDMVVIDKDGKIAYQGAIDDNDSTDTEDVKTAKNYVTAAIESISAGKPVEVGTTDPYGCSVKYKS